MLGAIIGDTVGSHYEFHNTKDYQSTTGRRPYGSWGNGSAMRVSTVGWFFDTLEETERVAEVSAAITKNLPPFQLQTRQASYLILRLDGGGVFLGRLNLDETVTDRMAHIIQTLFEAPQEAFDLVDCLGDRRVHLAANLLRLVFFGRPLDGRIFAGGRIENLVSGDTGAAAEFVSTHFVPMALLLGDNLFLHDSRLIIEVHGGEFAGCRIELKGVPGIDGLEALVPAYLRGGGKCKG